MEGKRVCVTGGSGFIGSWIVRLLLERGYSVHVTVQDLSNGREREHLEAMEGAKERLKLFQLDIMDYDSMEAAIMGCQGVFHVASPCILEQTKNPQVGVPLFHYYIATRIVIGCRLMLQAELLDPAVKETLNALEASRRANVKRVVITSSVASICLNPKWPPDTLIDENSWTDTDFCKIHELWYALSKTLAEKAAWDYAKHHGVDVVTVLPLACLGPLLQPTLNESSAILLNLLQGAQDYRYYWVGFVHVKDVANAHILLYETPSASGRFMCTNGITHYSDFAEAVAKICPEYPVYRKNPQKAPVIRQHKGLSKGKVGDPLT